MQKTQRQVIEVPVFEGFEFVRVGVPEIRDYYAGLNFTFPQLVLDKFTSMWLIYRKIEPKFEKADLIWHSIKELEDRNTLPTTIMLRNYAGTLYFPMFSCEKNGCYLHRESLCALDLSKFYEFAVLTNEYVRKQK